MFKKENESGQSILIIALIVLVLLALVALVVDVGNAYAHRRMVQNAVDAAAMAGAQDACLPELDRIRTRRCMVEVLSAVCDYAKENGLKPEEKPCGPGLSFGDREPIAVQSRLAHAQVPDEAVGVAVEGDLPFDTYFAHLLGFPTMQATADSAGYHTFGPCSGDCLFPVIVSRGSLMVRSGRRAGHRQGVHAVGAHPIDPGQLWLDLLGRRRGQPAGRPAAGTRGDVAESPISSDDCRSGGWKAGEWVHGDNGVNFQPVLDLLEQCVENESTDDGNDPHLLRAWQGRETTASSTSRALASSA